MKDRGGYGYVQGVDLMGLEKVPTFTHVVSPARQLKKMLGLSGRQYRKFRKLQRRLDKARELVRPLTVGEQDGTQVQEVQALREAEGAPASGAPAEGSSVEQDGGHGGEAA